MLTILAEILSLKNGAKECIVHSSRSRRQLSNEYLLDEIGVDTAENEPLEVWGENSIQYLLHSLLTTRRRERESERKGFLASSLQLHASCRLSTHILRGFWWTRGFSVLGGSNSACTLAREPHVFKRYFSTFSAASESFLWIVLEY